MPYISNSTKNKKIVGANGDDTIINSGAKVTIEGGGGSDVIRNSVGSVSADGGDGNDSINSSGGNKVTLHGGFGNDTLTGSSKAEVFRFRADGGNDVITNIGKNDTLYIDEGSLRAYYEDEDDLIIEIADSIEVGTMRLLAAADSPVKIKFGDDEVRTLNNTTINDIFNRKNRRLINGTKERDYIFNYSRNSTLNAATGDDTVINYGANVSIDGGAGNDYIENISGTSVTMTGGAGDDTLVGSSTLEVFQIDANGGNDLIKNFSTDRYSYDMIQIVDGTLSSCYIDDDDLIVEVRDEKQNVGSVRLNNITNGSIRIINPDGSRTSVAASNYIPNYYSYRPVSGSENNDYFYNTYSYVTINAGDGDDRVFNSGSNSSVNGGGGNDSIYGSQSGSTIIGGKGSDTIQAGNRNLIQYASGDGNDLIRNFGTNDTLQITSGSVSTHYSSGNDYIIGIKKSKTIGNITLEGAANTPIRVWNAGGLMNTLNGFDVIINADNHTLVSGSSGRDSISNNIQAVSINSGAGNDTVNNSAYYATIRAGAGNDSIRSYSYATVDGGAGHDFIYGYNYDSLFGGAGNDSVYGFSNSTVRGGAGNDTIVANYSGNVIQFGSEDGFDLIRNFSSNDTLQLLDGSIISHYADDNNYIVRVKGKNSFGKLTLEGAANTPIKVLDSDDKLGLINYDISNWTSETVVSGTASSDLIFNDAVNVTINAGKGDDIIRTSSYDVWINGGTGNDEITLGSYSTVDGGSGNDTVSSSSATGNNVYRFNAAGGNDLIRNFGRTDTLQITSGSIASHYSVGDDYVISLKSAKSSAVVTLEGAARVPIHVKNAGVINYVVYNSVSNTLLSGTSKADLMYNDGNFVTLRAGRRRFACNRCGGGQRYRLRLRS